MKSPVRPELTTASVVRRQATPAAVDNSASLQTRPMALIYRGSLVQINRATSMRPPPDFCGGGLVEVRPRWSRFRGLLKK